MAARYDELRPADAAWWEQFELTGTAGLAASTRLLDVGCGTGRLANAAAERFGLRAWGVDRSEAMVEQARARARGRASPSASHRQTRCRFATAGSTPSRCASSCTRSGTRARTRSARPRACSAPGGRVFIWTFAPEHFTGFYLAPYLPSLPAVDLARFPTPGPLEDELAAAGFATVAAARRSSRTDRSGAPRQPRACARATSRPCTCCRRTRSARPWPGSTPRQAQAQPDARDAARLAPARRTR